MRVSQVRVCVCACNNINNNYICIRISFYLKISQVAVTVDEKKNNKVKFLKKDDIHI